MNKAKEIVFNLPHIQLAARQWGDKDKPIILALHGWLDNANSFEPLAPLLHDYCLIAIDWPGHGKSQHRQQGYSLHLTDYVFDLDSLVLHLCEQFSISKIHILGHSFGGIIGAIYTSLFPEHVASLNLVEALSPLFENEQQTKMRLRQSIIQHRDLTNSSKTAKSYSSLESIAKNRHKLTELQYQFCLSILSRNITPSHNGVCLKTDPKLKLGSAWRYSEAQVLNLIDSVLVPSLLILGESGFAELQHAPNRLQDYFRQLTIVTSEGGHHVHMDNPRHVAAHICTMIEQL
ncbi:alpha/beta hydrolase [Parashewanella curva]|uniref:Alpha/beta hydrolase n=1 Tax=Parashewanella curva TaxID=2338552 RepID=A0A3L8Q2U1_9GAMM|nr:alpha/beta hydrolase [Parashewanella curva]RLV61253.1 alpha/beta hydrolase [Parashewanella curva]